MGWQAPKHGLFASVIGHEPSREDSCGPDSDSLVDSGVCGEFLSIIGRDPSRVCFPISTDYMLPSFGGFEKIYILI